MNVVRLLPLLLALAAVGAVGGARAEEGAGSLAEALAQGRPLLELRPRYNHIEESDKPQNTRGGTVRIAAGWRTAPWHGLRLTAELLHTDHIGKKRFNDEVALIPTSPYPLLPDPRHTGVNRLHLDYAAIEGMSLRLGRQIVRLDNQRFISDNDFRQIPTVFDGLTGVYEGFENVRLFAGHLRRLRNALGVTNDLELTLLNAAWNPRPGHALGAYTYLHDDARATNAGFANTSYRLLGGRAEGGWPVAGGIEARYLAELAWQRPFAGGDARIHARYWRLGAGLGTSSWAVRYDHEVKGSNAGLYGLQTPLTDRYGFNGWALRFTTTPREGLVDRWVTARWVLPLATLYVEAHRFRADFTGRDYGRELDVGVTVPLGENTLARLQHARYRPGAGQVAPDVDKTWLTFTYTY